MYRMNYRGYCCNCYPEGVQWYDLYDWMLRGISVYWRCTTYPTHDHVAELDWGYPGLFGVSYVYARRLVMKTLAR